MTTYKKTEAGEKEILHKMHGLNFLQRSVLLMVDGKRQVADIAKSLGGLGDVDSAVSHLLTMTLIQSIESSTCSASNVSNKAVSNVTDDNYLERLYTCKSAAILVVRRTLESALGPGADAFMLRLESAIDRPLFTRAMEGALNVIEQVRGADARDSLKAALVKLSQTTTT